MSLWCLGGVSVMCGGFSVVSLWCLAGGLVVLLVLLSCCVCSMNGSNACGFHPLCFSTQDMIRPALSIHERHGLSQEEFDCLRHL